jgi:hypothetical protein
MPSAEMAAKLFFGSPYMRGRQVDKSRPDTCYGSLRLSTERRGNQCSEERAELEGVANGPVATSDSTKTKHFEIEFRGSYLSALRKQNKRMRET